MEEGQVLRATPSAVAGVLETQNARFEASPARDAHLRALRDGAPAVVTGQQAGLFLGPLYTLYKVATAVRLARASRAVPVFWLQTEDHDLAEIASVRLAHPLGGSVLLALPAPAEPISIAHRTLPPEVERLLGELAEALGGLPHAAEHIECLSRHYRSGARWSDAFAGVLAELFAPEGLVILDPRDPALAPLAAPIHERALESWRETVQALAASGAGETVHVRDDAPLSFFHPEGPSGRRCRLRWDGTGFSEVGGPGRHALGDLLEVLRAEPLCFSTSALLRPILQDSWLPTSAYVGGPSEVAYFGQLGPLYDLYDLPRPTVVRRASLRLLGQAERRALARVGLGPDDIALSEDELLARARPAGPQGEVAARTLLEAFDRALAELAPGLGEIGEYATHAAAKTRSHVARAVEKLARNLDKAERLRDTALVEDLGRLKERLCPGGVPQERVLGMSYFAARYGERAFVERILEAAEPGDGRTKDLAL